MQRWGAGSFRLNQPWARSLSQRCLACHISLGAEACATLLRLCSGEEVPRQALRIPKKGFRMPVSPEILGSRDCSQTFAHPASPQWHSRTFFLPGFPCGARGGAPGAGPKPAAAYSVHWLNLESVLLAPPLVGGVASSISQILQKCKIEDSASVQRGGFGFRGFGALRPLHL